MGKRGSGRGEATARVQRGREGQSLMLFVVMLPFFLAIFGLVLDAGTIFAARREAQGIADAAARAGANELDVGLYRRTDGRQIELDGSLADEVARRYLADQGVGQPGLEGTVSVAPMAITVVVRREVPLGFLRLAGWQTHPIQAVAVAQPFVTVTGLP
jgi:Flp pilus assembly protein TadG